MVSAQLFLILDRIALFTCGLYAGTHVASCIVLHSTGASLPALSKLAYFRALTPYHARSNSLFASLTILMQFTLFVCSASPAYAYHYLLSALFAFAVFPYTSSVMFPLNDRLTST